MKKYPILFLVIIALFSCKSNSRVVTAKSDSKKYTTKKTAPVRSSRPKETVKPSTTNSTHSLADSDKIIRKALSFKGTKYKYGGMSKSGMDCSGLMYTSFKAANISLPRTSIDQSNKGIRISTSKVQKGDLLFFKTSRKNRVNHVGLVVSTKGSDIKFIHSSTSRGVMISSLKEGYWSSVFTEARRVLLGTEPNTKASVATNNSYTVKKGDTLYSIARKYSGVTANNIISYNNLQSTSIKPGMVLKIPFQN